MNTNMPEHAADCVVLSVDDIRRFFDQPRKYIDISFPDGLLASIKANGSPETPILVKPLDQPIDGCHYELINGERRWRACIMANIRMITARVRKVKNADEQYMLSVITNIQQETLTPMEIAMAVDRLLSSELSQREVGKRLGGKSQGWVFVRRSLLKLTPKALALAGPQTPEDQRLSVMQAYLLVGLPPEQQVKLGKIIGQKRLPISAARKLITDTIHLLGIPYTEKNSSRLMSAGDWKAIKLFATRTESYLNNFLRMKQENLLEICLSVTASEVRILKEIAERNSNKFIQLEKCLESIAKIKAKASGGGMKADNGASMFSEELPQRRSRIYKIDSGKLPTSAELQMMKTGRLLAFIGVPRHVVYGPERNKHPRKAHYRSYWDKPLNFMSILERAKRTCRTKIVSFHPDKINGDGEKSAALNEAWDIIRRRFKTQGFILG